MFQNEEAFIPFGVPADCSKPLGFAHSALGMFSTALFLRGLTITTYQRFQGDLKMLLEQQGDSSGKTIRTTMV